ncbi:MAG: glycosyltransferase [Pseudomonadota bacterium]
MSKSDEIVDARAERRKNMARKPSPRVRRGSSDRMKVSVAALVDLIRHPGSGGHVKAWERFADAATRFPDDLDLTVYYLGDGISETQLSPNVRLRTVPPAFGTASLPWLRNGGGDTDLASYNPHLARQLLEHDVFHATSSFAFAKTASVIAKTHGRPLVSSLHTDAAKFAKVYTGEIIERLIGPSMLSRWLIDGVGLPDRSARNLTRARDRMLAASDHILISDPEDERHLRALLPVPHISYLRRGIDKTLFTPENRDRRWLQERFGIPINCPVLLFAGRVDESKRVLTAARAARRLLDQGVELQLVIAGKGAEQKTIAEMLGERGTLTGNLAQRDLAKLMASSDLFVFPSESEIVCNVVIEAKASGLPVIVTGGATTSQLIEMPGIDGIVTRDGSLPSYVETIAELLRRPDERLQIARKARDSIEMSWPDWADVLAEDLLPVWRSMKARHGARRQPADSEVPDPFALR